MHAAIKSNGHDAKGVAFCHFDVHWSVSMNKSPVLAFTSLVVFLSCLACLKAVSVESALPLQFGMSTALTGPAAQLGINMKAGVETAFNEVNLAGGIQGRPLKLIALDDGYEPDRTVPNMHQLIDKDEVLAVIGNVGTPTAVASIPIANANKTLLFGTYSGAGVLRRTPPDRYVINYRASYAEETAYMVDGLVRELGLDVDEIAFFTQRDSYGDAGFVGGIAAMKRNGLTDESTIIHARYERNTEAVENGLADILAARKPVRAVIMVGAYAPCATFIKLARQFELDVLFLNVSFVGSKPLAETLGADGEGVIITQVVPHLNSDLPCVVDFHQALGTTNSTDIATYGTLEGYVAGRILIQGLKRIEGAPSRENLVDALEALGTFDIGLNTPLQLGPQEHQACHVVWPTRILQGKVVPFSWDDFKLTATDDSK